MLKWGISEAHTNSWRLRQHAQGCAGLLPGFLHIYYGFQCLYESPECLNEWLLVPSFGLFLFFLALSQTHVIIFAVAYHIVFH